MRNIVFFTESIGGGVGRVISVLSQAMVSRSKCYLICLNQTEKDIKEAFCNVDGIYLIGKESFSDFSLSSYQKIHRKGIRVLIAIIGHIEEIIKKKESDRLLVLKYYFKNYMIVKFLDSFLNEQNIQAEFVFLNQPIFQSLLSKNKDTKLIISERNDPNRFLKTKTTMAFIRKMYSKADAMVFQSPDVMQWYREYTNVKGKVIFNPIKPDLPERYVGKRKKKIVNFCRISGQKNLHLLVNAFEQFASDYPDYELYIYGDAVGNGAEGYIDSVKEAINQLKCKDSIFILPAQKDIHNIIKDYAMFVSSSDFEGMSNSMLEAMAIGLPAICTDCPAGGARAIIKDHENGILVPVNDANALANAMKEVAGDPELAEKLSVNGTKLREELSVDKIVNQWMEIIND